MFCNQAKAYLSQKGIAYVERDVTQDAAALEELKAMGLFTTPVIRIGQETIVGFDQARIEKALAG